MDKIICVGKNYAEHAAELGDAVPEKPVLFLKPPSVLVQVGSNGESVEVHLPRDRGTVHYECEIVLRLDATGAIKAVTLGLDMTLRAIQSSLKKQGHPWELAKVFRDSAVVGPWIDIAEFPEYLETEFRFGLDGTLRQHGRGTEMRSSPATCIEAARAAFPICDGDIVFTGTPAGVGTVVPGQFGELHWGGRLHYRVQFVTTA